MKKGVRRVLGFLSESDPGQRSGRQQTVCPLVAAHLAATKNRTRYGEVIEDMNCVLGIGKLEFVINLRRAAIVWLSPLIESEEAQYPTPSDRSRALVQ